ncbi:receptor-type tyrosine-protein phosphatase eta-like, partial [Fundulus diaphanus]
EKNVSETFLNITDLTAGEQYTISVTALAADNLTEGLNQIVSTYSKPEAVNNLHVSGVKETSLSLGWTQPNGERLFYTIKFENKTTILSTNETQGIVSELTPGEVYCFKVIAVAGDNQTESDERKICQFTKPEVVTDLSVTNKTTISVFVTWTKPKGSSSFYRVKLTGGALWEKNVSETFLNITDLTAGEQYTISVTALAADNLTEGLNQIVSTYSKPEVVRNLSVTEVTTVSISLNWTKPEGNSSFYKVQWTDGNMTWNSNETEPFINITNLIPGGNYEIKVTAVSGDNLTEGARVSVSRYTSKFVLRHNSGTTR